jgi:lipoprotein-releasing system permease protein
MFRPLPVWIGLRYTRARRRNQFISFISFTSMMGVALGVAALITVLSVMNGFEKELRGRILGMTSHATLLKMGGPLADWPGLQARLLQDPQVLGAAPFIQSQAMVTHGGAVTGVNVTGILPEEEPAVSVVAESIIEGDLGELGSGSWRVVLGSELARALRVAVGDSVTLVAPQPTTTAVGVTPRLRRFEVVGIFEVGMHDYDAGLALVHLEDAARLFRIEGGVTGLRIKLVEPMSAPIVTRQIARGLEEGLAVVDWTQFHVNFFRALKSERVVMFVILTLIVAVAAFNIVSTLVMLVTDKQADIAILRTLGFPARAVMGVFIVQGLVVGLVGILAGVVGGVWLASNVQWIVQSIERAFSVEFLPADVYYISELPSSLEWSDVLAITLVSFVLCVLATLYPAWKASRTRPVEALRYE